MSVQKEPSSNKNVPSGRALWTQLLGIGFEFGAVVTLFAFAGYQADQYFQTEPWCLLVAFFFALIGETYLIIKKAIQYRFNDDA